MSDRIYISSRYSRNHVAWIITKLASQGFDTSGICAWDSLGDFLNTLRSSDRVVVYSLSAFDDSVELLGALRLFLARNITIHSLREAELTQRLTLPLVEALFAVAVDGLFGQNAEAYWNVDPSRVGALVRMERFIHQEGLSTSEASRRSGCSRNVYYYYQRAKSLEVK